MAMPAYLQMVRASEQVEHQTNVGSDVAWRRKERKGKTANDESREQRGKTTLPGHLLQAGEDLVTPGCADNKAGRNEQKAALRTCPPISWPPCGQLRGMQSITVDVKAVSSHSRHRRGSVLEDRNGRACKPGLSSRGLWGADRVLAVDGRPSRQAAALAISLKGIAISHGAPGARQLHASKDLHIGALSRSMSWTAFPTWTPMNVCPS